MSCSFIVHIEVITPASMAPFSGTSGEDWNASGESFFSGLCGFATQKKEIQIRLAISTMRIMLGSFSFSLFFLFFSRGDKKGDFLSSVSIYK